MTTNNSSLYSMNIEKILEHLGFSPNEIRVYIATLQSGLSSAQEIAEKAGIKRTTAYSVLGYLVKRGVIGKAKVGVKTRFLASSPDKLMAMVDELRTALKRGLPELRAMYNAGDTKPRITFYEGDHAVQNVYDDTLAEKPDEILEWNTDEYFQFDQHKVDPHYIDKRVTLGIRAKRIAGYGSGWQKKHKRYDRSELSETLIVPRDQFWPSTEVNIYNDKVAFLNYAEQMSVIIESKAIANTIRQAYHLSWIGAQQIAVHDA